MRNNTCIEQICACIINVYRAVKNQLAQTKMTCICMLFFTFICKNVSVLVICTKLCFIN